MPAISTTRCSWISPQRPRACGWRSALTRLPVSRRSSSWCRSERDLLVSAGRRPRASSRAPGCGRRPSPATASPARPARRCLLALLELAFGALLELAERLRGELQEGFVVGLQRLADSAWKAWPSDSRAASSERSSAAEPATDACSSALRADAASSAVRASRSSVSSRWITVPRDSSRSCNTACSRSSAARVCAQAIIRRAKNGCRGGGREDDADEDSGEVFHGRPLELDAGPV